MNGNTLFRKAARLSAGLLFSGALVSGFAPLGAQEANPTSVPAKGAVVTQDGDIFFYKVQVRREDIDAINYLHRSGSTKLDFVGTSLLPNGKGDAQVKSERGGITIDAEFKNLTPANGFGPEYLTYVLWAISPDGRPANLGEVLPAGTKNDIHVTTALQSFGLIVTAEPYYAVTTPSDVIVLKNRIIEDRTNGVLEKVTAQATLLPRGIYGATTDGSKTVANPITRDEKSPLELYEAYNAVRIAEMAGAAKYSPDIFSKAQQGLKNAADLDSSKKRDVKLEITYARDAVQRAEDARVDTLRKQAAERQTNAELAKQQAQADAAQSAQAAAASQAQAQQAQLDAERARLASAQADAERAKAEAATALAQAQTAEANKKVEDANAVRERLRAQLNAVLQTTETARGLVVNMSDVLFDTGKYTLKQNTQLSLAKVAGILQAYPSLKVQVEGYTDSTGSDELNQKLSENRAGAVKDFLTKQGVSGEKLSSAGYGKADPVADNTTAAGRAQNRRVEMIVSGAAIGVEGTAGPANQ